MPIIQLLILPMAADYEIKNINISIVDHDHSSYSRELTHKIISSGYFVLNDYGQDYQSAFKNFEKDQSDIILEIPHDFEKNIGKLSASSLLVSTNAINGVKAGVGSAYLMQIISNYNQKIRQKWLHYNGQEIKEGMHVESRFWYNKYMKYTFFMVPGILGILVTMVGVYMCSLNIVKEKEIGTIEQINVTPIKKQYFILGKLIPFWLIGIFVFSVGLFVVARGIYGIIPIGSYFPLYAFLAIYLVAALGIGLLISTYSSTQQQSMSLTFFLMMIFILMSGLFTPIESMPEWAQFITKLNPVTYFIDVMRRVILKGSTIHELQFDFIVVSIMAAFFNIWAVLNYKKTN